MWNNYNRFDDLFETIFKSHFTGEADGHISFDKETEEYTSKIKAAGWTKEEIDIEVDQDKMLVSTELSGEDERKEYGVTAFKYLIKVRNIDSNSIDASLENGILTIKFKVEENKSRKKITIK